MLEEPLNHQNACVNYLPVIEPLAYPYIQEATLSRKFVGIESVNV